MVILELVEVCTNPLDIKITLEMSRFGTPNIDS
jgi:hypothetical protein